MDISTACEEFNKIMKEEILLLQQFCDTEMKLRHCIQEKDWSTLQQIIESLDPLTISISLMEQERERNSRLLCDFVSTNENPTFYSIISKLPEAWRDVLGATFREMKILVLKVQGLNDGISALVSTLSVTLQNILEELYPHRRGRIYSPTGKTKAVSANPMILNKQL